MPILRVSPGKGNDKSGKFLANSSPEMGKNREDSQVSNSLEKVNKGFSEGCKQCSYTGNASFKWINVLEVGRFCTKECWNNWIRENGSRINDNANSNKGKRLTAAVLGYRLRNDEAWLLNIKKIHSELQSAHHSSVYTCSCHYARNFRASELGLWFEETLILREEI